MSKGISQYEKCSAELRMMARARKERKFVMRARLAKRDLDYAESGHAAPVTVEQRGNVRIETRGPRVIGWRSAGHVSNNS